MEFSNEKQTMLSMIKPTGHFTLGNYLGALKNWVKLQDEYNSIFAVADLHAITIRIEPAKLRQQTLTAYGILNAIGLDPEKSLMFIQSTVPAHAELSWILSCYACHYCDCSFGIRGFYRRKEKFIYLCTI